MTMILSYGDMRKPSITHHMIKVLNLIYGITMVGASGLI
jgi:hypothetical protein